VEFLKLTYILRGFQQARKQLDATLSSQRICQMQQRSQTNSQKNHFHADATLTSSPASKNLSMSETSTFILQKSEQAKEELEEIAQKVSAKADEISRDFAKTTEDLKQAAPSTEDLKQAAPKVPPEVQKSLGPEKVPSGPYSFQEVFRFAGLAPEVSILTLFG
jgi:hypothetical protein